MFWLLFLCLECYLNHVTEYRKPHIHLCCRVHTWLLLLIHCAQPLGPEAHSPWPSPFTSHIPALSPTHSIFELFTPKLSWYMSMLIWFLPLLLLSWLLLLPGPMYVPWFMYICVYWSYEITQFIGSFLQKVTSVCILLFALWSLRYYSTTTGVCLICCVFHITLTIFITHSQ